MLCTIRCHKHGASLLHVPARNVAQTLLSPIMCGEVENGMVGHRVSLRGWLSSFRQLNSSLTFLSLRDGTGQLQVKLAVQLPQLPPCCLTSSSQTRCGKNGRDNLDQLPRLLRASLLSLASLSSDLKAKFKVDKSRVKLRNDATLLLAKPYVLG